MTKNSECVGDTARYAEILDSDDRFELEPGGHTDKVLFFKSRVTGHVLAIEKRIGAPPIYFRHELQHRTSHRFTDARLLPKGTTGRNSNLKRAFGDLALLRVKPKSDLDFLSAVGCLV